MKLGKVIGNVVCTQKIDSFKGLKLLLIQPLDEKLQEMGESAVACDTVQAGIGDIIFYESGREAALGLKNWFNPSDMTIMGIVDQLNIGESL